MAQRRATRRRVDERVRKLQQALILAGMQRGRPDGTFGPRTREAVRKFQRTLGLPVTGVVDRMTEASLLASRPQEAPPVLNRNPANPYQRHLLPDDRPPLRRRRF
jgi:peptidoglycan hydrolase-like protein with peptidoglycan-binding domain